MKNALLKMALCLSFGCFIINSGHSQSEKTNIGILPFSYSIGAASSQDATAINEAVTNAFVKTKQFNILDRTKMDVIKSEKELQKSEDFIDGSVVEQGKSLGANFLISGHVTSAKAEAVTTTDSKTGVTTTAGYKAKLAISLKIIDVSTSQIIISENLEPKGGSMMGALVGVSPKTPEAAITKAIKDIEPKIDEFVSKNFPLTFTFVEIQEKDGAEAKKVLISGGSGFGLKKGDKLKVIELVEMEVNGKKMMRKKEIGEIKILKVEDENFSQCQVLSGGTEINSKFETKAKLQVITLTEK